MRFRCRSRQRLSKPVTTADKIAYQTPSLAQQRLTRSWSFRHVLFPRLAARQADSLCYRYLEQDISHTSAKGGEKPPTCLTEGLVAATERGSACTDSPREPALTRKSLRGLGTSAAVQTGCKLRRARRHRRPHGAITRHAILASSQGLDPRPQPQASGTISGQALDEGSLTARNRHSFAYQEASLDTIASAKRALVVAQGDVLAHLLRLVLE